MLAILGLKPAALGATVAATNKRLKLDAANAMQVCPPHPLTLTRSGYSSRGTEGNQTQKY